MFLLCSVAAVDAEPLDWPAGLGWIAARPLLGRVSEKAAILVTAAHRRQRALKSDVETLDYVLQKRLSEAGSKCLRG